MGKLQKNLSGFGAVEVVLVLFIVGLLGFVGWFVHNSNKKASDNLRPVTSSVRFEHKKKAGVTGPAPASPDPTADWQTFKSTNGAFSVKYPKTWVQPTNQQYCDKTALGYSLYLGPDENSVLKCGTDGGFGEISLDSNKENNSGFDFSSGYTNVVKKSVTVNGVIGQRIAAISSGQKQLIGSLPDGTIVVEYTFNTNGKFYVAHYIQKSSYQDVLENFDSMISKTLKFE